MEHEQTTEKRAWAEYLPGGKKRKLAALAGALVFDGLLLWAIAAGLAGKFTAPAPPPPVTLTVTTEPSPRPPPPPVAPPPEPVPQPEGGAAPPAPRANVPPVPRPAIPLASPSPAPTAAGNAEAGAGSGAGGTGSGTGAGGEGSGSGSGIAAGLAAPARRLSGALSDRDYPRDAGRAAGTVAIGFTVRADGGVEGCTVLQSSGSARLDGLTCQLVEQRFRYRPAQDRSGRPVPSQVRTSFTWGTR